MADEIVHAPAPTLKRLRALCLRFPDAVETGGVGNPSFKVRDRIFAMQHGHEGRPSCWVKAEKGVQELLVGHDAARFFRPPYVGQHGWIGVRLDGDGRLGRARRPRRGELPDHGAEAARSAARRRSGRQVTVCYLRRKAA